MRHRIILLVALAVFVFQHLHAQSYKPLFDNFKTVTPAEFQFIKYTEMPVSEYTGIPSISIPLYEIQEDGVKIPVNLSYHSNGIRVSEEAGWVGLGWNLQFGSIIQTVNDGDDFGSYMNKPLVKMRPDYFYGPLPTELPRRWDYSAKMTDAGHWIPGPGWSNPFPIAQTLPELSYKIVTDYYMPVKGDFDQQRLAFFQNHESYDAEPDIFQANFPGHSINFILDWDGPGNTFIVLNKKGYQVSKNGDTWAIKVPTGEQFFFEEKAEVKTSSIASACGSGSLTTSSKMWMLTRVVTNNKRTITFNYQRTPNGKVFPNFSQNWKLGVLGTAGIAQSELLGYPSDACGISNAFGSSGLLSYDLSTSTEDRLIITSIVFPKGKIDFSLSARNDVNNEYKLDRISVSAASVTKEFKFNYDYFDYLTAPTNGYNLSDDYKPYANLRLRLKSLRQSDGALYEFTYNNKPLPPKNCFAQDFWGFYNGNLTNTSLIPNPKRFKKTDLGDNGNNHSANIEYAKAGILEKIKYPTGGTVEFEYELNQFDNVWYPDYAATTNTISSGNGLRIKSVIHKRDDQTQSKKTVYSYSGGKAILPIQVFKSYPYTWLMPKQGDQYYARQSTINEVSAAGFYAPSPFSSINGIGYDQVAMQDVDPSGNALGKKTMQFYNNPDKVNSAALQYCQLNVTLPAIKNSALPENGSVKTVSYYDNTTTLLKQEDYQYVNKGSNYYYGARLFGYRTLFILNDKGVFPFQQNMIGYYPIFDFETLVSKSTATSYANGQALKVETTNSYDNYNQLALSTVRTLNTDYVTETNISRPVYGAGILMWNSMVTANRLSDIVSLSISKKYDNGSATEVYKYLKTFRQEGDRILEDAALVSKRKHPYADDPQKINYNRYDASNGNLQQYTVNGQTTSLFWDYNNQYNVAKITNATYGDVAYTSFEAEAKGNWTFAGTPVNDNTAPTGKMCYSLTAGTMTKSGLNSVNEYVVSYWSKNGICTVSGSVSSLTGNTVDGWTYYQHLVKNSTSISISGAATIDEVRLYPKNAQLVSYTYAPLVGITSECDAGNSIAYYDYDILSRLSLIRDAQKNIRKKFCYDFAGNQTDCVEKTFKNAALPTIFTRNNCSGSAVGSAVTYTVPAGKYTSTISQADADAQAEQDANVNGQNYANTNGTCTSYNINFLATNNTNETITVLFVSTITGPRSPVIIAPNSANVKLTIPAGKYHVAFSSSDKVKLYQYGITYRSLIGVNNGTLYDMSFTTDGDIRIQY
ncbi:DUF5977 domain-containing protein [Danxiaibacter flavus]|uniref:DUF5977 domain-containing protein n=1 Tax=Danxiaibacter flavus TaxID=3049108 RepID=A0ABV3ZH95_9BACT|nr:DUF5977 domain-containing protein [Chitinophagaceae bacterium DXS]